MPILHARALRRALLCLCAAVAACDDDASPRPLAACVAGTELSASASTQPMFEWSPDCAATHLLVTDQASGDTLWFLGPLVAGGTVRSGYRYGTVSPSHRPLPGHEPVPLEEGGTYVVSLFTSASTGLALVGQQAFSPELTP